MLEKELKNKHNKLHKYISVLILISIVFYGIFKPWVLNFYTYIIFHLSILLDLNIEVLEQFIKNNSQGDWNRNKVAWIIYYPSYFLLHVSFIYFLFKNELRARNLLILGLTMLISCMLIFIILGKVLDHEGMFNISWNFFKGLFGLPFILLSIEGGRILYNDILKRNEEIEA